MIRRSDFEEMKTKSLEMVERQARVVIEAPWPEPHEAGLGVFKDDPPRVRIEVMDPAWRAKPDESGHWQEVILVR